MTGKLDARTLDVAQTIGYTVQPNNYYSEPSSAGFPARPSASTLASPDNATRTANFKCFKFKLPPRDQRPDKEGIVIDGKLRRQRPRLDRRQCHQHRHTSAQVRERLCQRPVSHAREAAPQFAALFAKWEAADLLHLIMSFEGCFVPRYKRGLTRPPLPNAGHGIKKSTDADAGRLSNHAFGSAFDINFTDNQLGTSPRSAGSAARRANWWRRPTRSASTGAVISAPPPARTACISRSANFRKMADARHRRSPLSSQAPTLQFEWIGPLSPSTPAPPPHRAS